MKLSREQFDIIKSYDSFEEYEAAAGAGRFQVVLTRQSEVLAVMKRVRPELMRRFADADILKCIDKCQQDTVGMAATQLLSMCESLLQLRTKGTPAEYDSVGQTEKAKADVEKLKEKAPAPKVAPQE